MKFINFTIIAGILLLHLVLPVFGETEEISDQEKKNLLKSIETFRNNNNSRKLQLIKAGIAVLTPAANNGNAALALYEKCYKEVEFTRKGKKEKEWREWLDNNKENLSSPASKQMLCYQIQWALITLKAGMESEETYDPIKYAQPTISLLTKILNDEKVLANTINEARTSIINGPIGKVYELGLCRPESWPNDIMDSVDIVDKLLLETYRQRKDHASLRTMWNNLINLEKQKHETLKKSPTYNTDDAYQKIHFGGDTADDYSYIPFHLENLAWLREVDCYRCGAQLSSAQNMIAMMKSTKDYKKLTNYAHIFLALLEEKPDENSEKSNLNMDIKYGVLLFKPSKTKDEENETKNDK